MTAKKQGFWNTFKAIKAEAAADKAAYRAAKAHVELDSNSTQPNKSGKTDIEDEVIDTEKEFNAEKWKIGHKTPSRLINYDASTATNIDFYREYLAQRLHNGTWDAPMSTRSTDITLGYRKIFTKSTEKVVYMITNYPVQLKKYIFDDIRNVVERYGVVVNFSIKMTPHTINWESNSMKERVEKAQKRVSNKQKLTKFSTSSEYQKAQANDRLAESFGYFISLADRGAQTCFVSIAIEICRVRNDVDAYHNFIEAQHQLKKYCRNLGLKEVKGELYEYLRARSPMIADFNSTVLEVTRLFSDEIVARLTGFRGGPIGTTGTLMGRDITNNYLVYKNFVRSGGEAENLLIAAETGSGKSVIAKVLEILLQCGGFNMIIQDIDGEYSEACDLLGGVKVAFESSYFDTMPISDPTGDPKIDVGLYADAMQSTASLWSALVDIEKGMNIYQRRIFNDAYNRLLDRFNVIESDPTTWGNSKVLNYKLLYEEIKSLSKDSQYISDSGIPETELHSMVIALSVFFEERGLYSRIFQRKIDINDILNRKRETPQFIDLVLNLQNDDQSEEGKITQTIKLLTASYLVLALTNRFKQMGEFTAQIIEEYQRYARLPMVSSQVLTSITGNRKRNAITILITNSPLQLLKSADISAYAVIENINNYIIGALKPRTIDAVVDVFNLDNCGPLLNAIATNPKYKYCFLMKLDNRDVTIAKWDLPQSLLSSPLFKTRDTKKQIKRNRDTLRWEDIREDVHAKMEAGRQLALQINGGE